MYCLVWKKGLLKGNLLLFIFSLVFLFVDPASVTSHKLNVFLFILYWVLDQLEVYPLLEVKNLSLVSPKSVDESYMVTTGAVCCR